MARRSNHYEAAFEAFMREMLVPCVAVDECRRPLTEEGSLKNPDFLIYPKLAQNLVVEVKGKWGKDLRGRRPWENWVTTDDLDALVRWQQMFGPGFVAALVFVYAEAVPQFALPAEADSGFPFRGYVYRFWTVALDDYVAHLRSRGMAWKAVAMARDAFRARVRPLAEWIPMTEPDRARPTGTVPRRKARQTR
jgi:hypothetical protein